MQDYVLIAQDAPHVEHFQRQGALWILSETRDPAESLAIASIGTDLPLAEIYDRLFPAP